MWLLVSYVIGGCLCLSVYFLSVSFFRNFIYVIILDLIAFLFLIALFTFLLRSQIREHSNIMNRRARYTKIFWNKKIYFAYFIFIVALYL